MRQALQSSVSFANKGDSYDKVKFQIIDFHRFFWGKACPDFD
jgi:hypothetical protein